MKLSISQLMSLGAMAVMLSTTAVWAGPADDAIKGRQACMKAQGGAVFGLFFPMLKGEKPYDAAVVKEAIGKRDAACADWAKWWGADTQKGETLETRAKPEIWTDAAGFEAAGGAAYQAFEALKAAGDEAAFKAALPAVGKGCQGCHEKFQRPKG